MKNIIKIQIRWLLAGLVSFSFLNAQGISRSTGIGLRVGFWQTDLSAKVSPTGTVEASGAGSVYFFHRLKDNWFLETSIGSVGESKVGIGTVESSSLVPFLFGARYDLLSQKYNSLLQPYLSFGAGSYFESVSKVGFVVEAKTNAEPGIYLGAGVNAVISSWFSINTDIKYHLIKEIKETGRDYSGPELNIGFAFMWGSKPEIFSIESVKLIVKDIYPAYYQFYNTYPLALAEVKNMADYPIEINIHSKIDGYTERSKESGFIKIDPGETSDVPILALFGNTLLNTSQREPAVIDLEIESRSKNQSTKKMSLNVLVHGRNAWDGQIDRLGFFITPDDNEILAYSNSIINRQRADSNTEINNFQIAQILFNELQKNGIHYQSDPNIPFYRDDYVQFAAETIEKKSGDCDDLVVLYASLLESLGIHTAFVEVKENNQFAHLYLLFDSGLKADQGALISSNEKRYIIRAGRIWIPVETTLVDKGFETAWESGALSYLEEGIINSGIPDGWVKVIDID